VAKADREKLEAIALKLLQRYGVVFRKIPGSRIDQRALA
jgi:hypothetical protein